MKDQQLDKILQTLRELPPVEPSSFRYARIRHKIAEKKAGNEHVPGKIMWEMAAAFMLLVTLNISVIYAYSSETADDVVSTTSATDVLGLDTDNNYYENNY